MPDVNTVPSQQPTTTIATKNPINWKNIGIGIAVGLVVVAVALGAFYLYLSNQTKFANTTTNTATKSATTASEAKEPGQIAYVKDSNIWISDAAGKAKQITENTSEGGAKINFDHPTWSPNNAYLSFFKHYSYTNTAQDRSELQVFHNNKINTFPEDFHALTSNFYINTWVTNQDLVYVNQGAAQNVNKSDWYFPFQYTLTNVTGSSPASEGLPFNLKKDEQCGGGGAPEWQSLLSVDNGAGYGSGLRSTLIYLAGQKDLLISRGCDQTYVQIVTTAANSQKNFDPSYSGNGSEEHIPKTYQELVLSPDKKTLAGNLNGNIILVDLSGNLLKTLTSSNEAYSPVFSPDGKKIYYTDGVSIGKKAEPVLMVVNVDGSGKKTIYNPSITGAIANISSSPAGDKIIFTLITQTAPPKQACPNCEIVTEAREDIYIVNSDGSNPHLFASDARQPDWSSK